ncbi:Putative ribonuclease H protein At1g65750 [Linum perenne]
MTNEERRRRHISPDAICPECQGDCEDVEHVFRSCSLAQSIWRSMLPQVLDGSNANANFSDWWIKGIGDGKSSLSFGIIAWLLWRRRNRLVFNSEKLSVSEVCSHAKFWIHLYSSSWKTLQASREAPSIARQARLIGWRPAEEGWFSLNSDGSLYKDPTSSAAGGVIRDAKRQFHCCLFGQPGCVLYHEIGTQGYCGGYEAGLEQRY